MGLAAGIMSHGASLAAKQAGKSQKAEGARI
jgi:hypothetical protein